MTTPLSLALRQARLLATRDHMDAGGARLLAYTGTELPTTPETATSETLLCSIPLASPSGAIGAAADLATLTLSVPRVAPALATGIIGWVRFVDGAGAGLMDLLAGTSGSGKPVTLSAAQVYEAGEVQLLACVIAE